MAAKKKTDTTAPVKTYNSISGLLAAKAKRSLQRGVKAHKIGPDAVKRLGFVLHR